MRSKLDGDGKLVDPFEPRKIKALMPVGPNMVGVTLDEVFEASEQPKENGGFDAGRRVTRLNLLPMLHNNCFGVVALPTLKRPSVMIGLVRLYASQPHQLGALRTERELQ